MQSMYPPERDDVFRFLPDDLPPAETDGLISLDMIENRLASLITESVDPALDDLVEAVTTLFSSIHVEGSPANRILTQAFNDVIDLVRDVRQGRGRPAALLSRALFEHLVNFCTVEGSDVAAKRYVDSQAVAIDLMIRDLKSGIFASQLLPEFSESAWPTAVKDLESVISEHGADIRSRTFTTNLFNRAKAHGYEDDYLGYRLLSQIVHGAAGGAAGLTADPSDAPPVHRLGPSLGIAAFAYRWGFQWFLQLINEMSNHHPELATNQTTKALRSVLSVTGEYLSATQQLNRWLQPTHQPRDPRVLALIVLRPGHVGWYVFYPHLNMVAKAHEPEAAAQLIAKFEQQIAPLERVRATHSRDVTLIAEVEIEPISRYALPAHGLLEHDPKKNSYGADFWQGEDGVWQWRGADEAGVRRWRLGPN